MNATTRAAGSAVLLALALSALWLFWPSALGGGTTYVVTHGNSMEPAFHTGDLAILRPAGGYAVGDVVAYRSPSLDTVVMHRIVDEENGRLVLQGDNNDWSDADETLPDEVLGELFLRVPRGGIALDALDSPGALAFVLIGCLTVFGNAHRPRGRCDRRGPRSAGRGRRAAGRGRWTAGPGRWTAGPGWGVTPSGGWAVRRRAPGPSSSFAMAIRARARQVAQGAGGVVLVTLLGGGVLLVLPSTQTDSRTLQVIQQGRFSYTGAAVPGTTYPTGVIATRDTVWTKLAEQVTVSYATRVVGPELSDLRGTVRLDVVVTAADGWTAVVASGAEAVLEKGSADASVVVHPAAAGALLGRHYSEIGGAGSGATLTVTPVVGISGRAEGRRFTAATPAGFSFALDAASLRPATEDLTPSTPTSVEVEQAVPRSFDVLGANIPIGVARWAVAGILAVALVVLVAAGWLGRNGRGDVAEQFLVRHADRILPVTAFPDSPAVIDVSDAESLRRVAERFDTVVLHLAAEHQDVFAVRDLDATYRLVVPGSPGRRSRPPVPAAASPPLESTTPLPLIPTEPAPAASRRTQDPASGTAAALRSRVA